MRWCKLHSSNSIRGFYVDGPIPAGHGWSCQGQSELPAWCTFRLLGKAQYQMDQLDKSGHAEEAYRMATGLNADNVLAWKGLAEVHAVKSPDSPEAVEALEHVVSM